MYSYYLKIILHLSILCCVFNLLPSGLDNEFTVKGPPTETHLTNPDLIQLFILLMPRKHLPVRGKMS